MYLNCECKLLLLVGVIKIEVTIENCDFVEWKSYTTSILILIKKIKTRQVLLDMYDFGLPF